jgi:hypothetical protein
MSTPKGRSHDVVKIKNASLKKRLQQALENAPANRPWSSLWWEETAAHGDTGTAWREADGRRRQANLGDGPTATFTAVLQQCGSGKAGQPSASEQRCGTAPVLVTLSLQELMGLLERAAGK